MTLPWHTPFTGTLISAPKWGLLLMPQNVFFNSWHLFHAFPVQEPLPCQTKTQLTSNSIIFYFFRNRKDFIPREYIGIHLNYDPNHHIVTCACFSVCVSACVGLWWCLLMLSGNLATNFFSITVHWMSCFFPIESFKKSLAFIPTHSSPDNLLPSNR